MIDAPWWRMRIITNSQLWRDWAGSSNCVHTVSTLLDTSTLELLTTGIASLYHPDRALGVIPLPMTCLARLRAAIEPARVELDVLRAPPRVRPTRLCLTCTIMSEVQAIAVDEDGAVRMLQH